MRSGEVYLLNRAERQPVRRGEVVVFDHGGVTYIKRVLATGGDTVVLVRHRGAREHELVMSWQVEKLERALRREPWRSAIHLVRLRVPEGECFVLGDHVEESIDSRTFGTVPTSAIRGKVLFAKPAQPEFEHVAVNALGRRRS